MRRQSQPRSGRAGAAVLTHRKLHLRRHPTAKTTPTKSSSKLKRRSFYSKTVPGACQYSGAPGLPEILPDTLPESFQFHQFQESYRGLPNMQELPLSHNSSKLATSLSRSTQSRFPRGARPAHRRTVLVRHPSKCSPCAEEDKTRRKVFRRQGIWLRRA